MSGERTSTDSIHSSRSSLSEEHDRPAFNEHSTSSSALILVRDDDEEAPDPLYLPSDDEEDDAAYLAETGRPDVPPVSSFVAFLYFLSPNLKLGALLILAAQQALSMKLTIPTLFVFAFLSAFARQILFLLARYVQKPSLEDIVLEALARGRRQDKRKKLIKLIVRFGQGGLRLLLSAVYFRAATEIPLRHVPKDLGSMSSKFMLGLLFVFCLFPLCLATNLASKRIVYSTGASIVVYFLWLVLVIFAHAKGLLTTDAVMLPPSDLWRFIPIMAFAFNNVTTLRLYASIVGKISPGVKKEKRLASISFLSLESVILGALLVLPLLFVKTVTKNVAWSERDEPSIVMTGLLALLTSLNLLLAIPSLTITIPPIPTSRYLSWPRNVQASKAAFLVLMFILCFVPETVYGVLCNILIVVGLLGTYVLPALIHIIHHQFRRPRSIILQQPNTPNPDSSSTFPSDRDPTTDELLRRKEKALQRRRTGRRILWDIGVWVLLIPIGGGGIAWLCGHLAGIWS